MKLIKLWEKIGKQPLKISQYKEVFVKSGDDEFFITGINYNNGEYIGLQAEKICCETCKNNPDYNNNYALCHTCDICTALDQEEKYEMWELKK